MLVGPIRLEEASRGIAIVDIGHRSLDRRTGGAYLSALERLFVVEDVPAWSVELRSRARLRQSAKRHLADPSLAVAALGANPERLMSDLATFGLLFESLAVRDLRVYAESARSHLAHYRDSNGLEVDVVIERGDGAWVACRDGAGRQVHDSSGRANQRTTRCALPRVSDGRSEPGRRWGAPVRSAVCCCRRPSWEAIRSRTG